MALGVAVALGEFVQNCDRGVCDNLSKKDDAPRECDAVVPTPVELNR